MKKAISKIQARSCFWLPSTLALPLTGKRTLKLRRNSFEDLRRGSVTFGGRNNLGLSRLTESQRRDRRLVRYFHRHAGRHCREWINLDACAIFELHIQPGSLGAPNFPDSTINDTSPQYSYSNIYAVSAPLADQVGYVTLSGSSNVATITINFNSAILNPIFQVANLDGMQYDFSKTVGLNGLDLLSGNGGGGDGILVTDDVISDADPTTVIG